MKYGDEVRVTGILVLSKCYCLCFFFQFNCKLRPCLPVVMSNQYNLQFVLCVFFVGENVLNTMF